MPECEVYDVPGVGEVCGYHDVAQWRLILAADSELVMRRAEVKELSDKVETLHVQVGALEGALRASRAARAIYEADAKDLASRLKATNKALEEAKVDPGRSYGWIAAGVLATALASVIVGTAL